MDLNKQDDNRSVKAEVFELRKRFWFETKITNKNIITINSFGLGKSFELSKPIQSTALKTN